MKNRRLESSLSAIVASGALLVIASVQATAASLTGNVLTAGQPVAGATVTLFAAGPGAPTQLAQGDADDNGAFTLTYGDPPAERVLYIIAKGGAPKAAANKGANDSLVLLALLGAPFPNSVTVNELTTVASAFTAARFIEGEAISGGPLGLRIAAGNTPNLVDLQTGGWGKVIVDPGNSTWTSTLANLDTLGSLISAYATLASDDWRARFLKAATPPSGVTPKNTLQAMAGIARTPWAEPQALYALFDEAYPQPKDGSRRTAPFAPYLAYPPTDFTLALWFGGGGSYSNGNMVFDAEGNMWCGVNWLPGSQSGVRKSIGGGLIKFSPNGTALSPPITGFTGMGVDGIGWGTAVALDKVWVASFNGNEPPRRKPRASIFGGEPWGSIHPCRTSVRRRTKVKPRPLPSRKSPRRPTTLRRSRRRSTTRLRSAAAFGSPICSCSSISQLPRAR